MVRYDCFLCGNCDGIGVTGEDGQYTCDYCLGIGEIPMGDLNER